MDPSPSSAPRLTSPSGGLTARPKRPRLRKACQRCRLRKQRCAGQGNTCRNCASARVECVPATQEPMSTYPVDYVKSLEQHVAVLENTLNNQVPDSATDHLPRQVENGNQHSEESLMWHMSPNTSPASLGEGQNTEHLFSIIHEEPENFQDVATSMVSTYSPYASNVPEVSVSDGASFFQTYFELIHPRYPFLDVEECSTAYLQWKAQASSSHNTAWMTFLVKMILAIGSLLQKSNLDHVARTQHNELMAQAQAEQSIMTSDMYSPLIRLQAMLLYAIYAVHGESTSRIVHITGVVMRFSTLHGFHELQNDGSPEMNLKIKAWSCAYAIDKMVAITLRIPTYPADEWILSPLYESQGEGQFFMPWSLDAPGLFSGRSYIFDLRYFSHMCKIRRIHSRILSTTKLLSLEDRNTFITKMRDEIDRWAHADQVSANGQVNAEGYSSTLGLVHIGHLTLVVLYSSLPIDPISPFTEELLQACCNACISARLLQKTRQIPKPWFDMVFMFQMGVVILYILWQRAVPPSKLEDRAIRNCTSTLGIHADRAANSENYRECLDLLASSVLLAEPLGMLDQESKGELALLVEKVVQKGVAQYITLLLRQMIA